MYVVDKLTGASYVLTSSTSTSKYNVIVLCIILVHDIVVSISILRLHDIVSWTRYYKAWY